MAIPIVLVFLPIGSVSITAVILLLKLSPPLGTNPTRHSPWDILRQAVRLSFTGATLVAGTATCLVLTLQWGVNTKAWDDESSII
jgi:hypothetical protein